MNAVHYVVDTSAWVEYLLGTAKGEKVKRLLEAPDSRFFTFDGCAAEIYSWAKQENRDFAAALQVIQANSMIVTADLNDWVQAAIVRDELRKSGGKTSILDAVQVIKARQLGARNLSADYDFKRVKKVKLV